MNRALENLKEEKKIMNHRIKINSLQDRTAITNFTVHRCKNETGENTEHISQSWCARNRSYAFKIK